MRRGLIALLIPVAALIAQAPANVDDALRGRVTAFYQYHVEGKFRLAEPMVAEESKDDFYVGTKQKLESFKISDITYSNDYHNAKVTLIAKMGILFAGMTVPQIQDVPMPSYWKMENGEWRWYLNKANLTDAKTDFKPVELADVMSQISVDRSAIKVKAAVGSTGQFTITNSLPGAVTLDLSQVVARGFEVKADKTELKAGEKAVVSVRSVAGPHSDANVRVIVQPVNRVLDVAITFIN